MFNVFQYYFVAIFKFIGQKLKEYRKKASLSQEQIAEKTGLAEKHYGR